MNGRCAIRIMEYCLAMKRRDVRPAQSRVRGHGHAGLGSDHGASCVWKGHLPGCWGLSPSLVSSVWAVCLFQSVWGRVDKGHAVPGSDVSHLHASLVLPPPSHLFVRSGESRSLQEGRREAEAGLSRDWPDEGLGGGSVLPRRDGPCPASLAQARPSRVVSL